MGYIKAPFKCQNCGASMSYNEETEELSCIYCGATPVLNDIMHAYLKEQHAVRRESLEREDKIREAEEARRREEAQKAAELLRLQNEKQRLEQERIRLENEKQKADDAARLEKERLQAEAEKSAANQEGREKKETGALSLLVVTLLGMVPYWYALENIDPSQTSMSLNNAGSLMLLCLFGCIMAIVMAVKCIVTARRYGHTFTNTVPPLIAVWWLIRESYGELLDSTFRGTVQQGMRTLMAAALLIVLPLMLIWLFVHKKRRK